MKSIQLNLTAEQADLLFMVLNYHTLETAAFVDKIAENKNYSHQQKTKAKLYLSSLKDLSDTIFP